MDIVTRIETHFPQIKAAMDQVPSQFAPGWLEGAAAQEVGLTDFGPDIYQDSLARLCQSINDDADLNGYGRLLLAGVIRNQLGNRLLMQRVRVQDPGKLAQRPLAPIIVTGLPRTGTTFLHRLLAADPAHVSLPYWQLNRPIPKGPDDTEAQRIADVNAMVDIRRKITPELDATHMIRAESPEECMWLTASSMHSRMYWNLAPAYGWLDWYLKQDRTNKYREYLEFLSYLQTLYPGKRFVLKAPDHVDGVDELLDVIPEARVICTHRNIEEQFGSYLSLGRTTRRLAVNTLDSAKEAEAVTKLTDVSLAKMETARTRHKGKVLDVRYSDMMGDPLAVVEQIYAHCDLTLPPSRKTAIADHHAQNPKGKHGSHEYSLAEFGLNNADIAKRYSAYSERFL